MRRYSILILCVLAFFQMSGRAYANDGQFQYFVINIANGLNTNNVNDCIKDKRGFLWVATDFGITRYAGQNSLHFSTDSKSGKTLGHLTKLLVTDSIIYAAGSTGFYTINPWNCSITKVNLKPNIYIHDMVFYKDQIILSSREGFLFFYTPKTRQIEVVPMGDNNIINILVKDQTLFCLSLQTGCILFDLDTRKIKKTLLISPFTYLDRFYLTKKSEVLLSSKDYVRKFDARIADFVTTAQLKNTTGYKEIGENNLFFITDNHQLFFRDKENTIYPLYPPVGKSTEFKKIKGDLNDDVYIISNQGLIIVRKITPFRVINAFGDQQVHVQRAIYEDTIYKRILFFSYDKLGVYDPQKKSIQSTPLNLVTHTLLEYQNDLLLVTEGSKLYSLTRKDLKVKQLFVKENPPLQFIAAAKSPDGTIFLGTLNGLYQTKDLSKGINRLTLVHQGKDLSDMQVKTIWVNTDGKIWVGGTSGILVLNKQWEIMDHYAVGYPQHRSLPVDEVNCFYPTQTGLYAGLDGELAFIPFNGSAPQFFYSRIFGKSNNRIVSIVEDKNQEIWFATYKGVFRLSPQNGSIRSFHAPIYFTNDEFNRSSSLRSRSGKLYFGNIAEYVEIDPDQYRDTIKPAIFQFNMARIFSATNKETIRYDLKDGDQVTLPLEGASIDISYSLNDLINSDQLTYQYRMKSVQADWVDMGNRTSLQLFSLPAGRHLIQIRAIGNDGYASNILNLNLLVPAIFYKTLWFNVLIILFILVLTGIFIWIRMRNLRKILLFRKEISNELHDAVGTTVTKSIYAAQSLMNEADVKDKRLQQIIDYGRQINANFRDVLWSLEKNTDPIVNLFDRINEIGNHAVANTPFDFQMTREQIDLEFSLTIRQKRDLLMISREAIHNVLKHSNGDLIRFHFSLQKNKLHLKITDNGKNTDSEIRSGGMGLESMRLRARKMGAEKITFRKDSDGFEVYLVV